MNLNKGDKIARQDTSIHGTFYDFFDVVKTTKTMAILSNGARLWIDSKGETILTGERYWHGVGADSHTYRISSPEIIAYEKERKEFGEIKRWFDSHKFTNEEKRQVHNLLVKTETISAPV